MVPNSRAETAKQVRAFEDYWSLGPTRTVVALAANYRRTSGEGQKVPTRRKRTLDEWSATYGWPERAAQREREEAAEADRKNRERVQKFRERSMRVIEIEAAAFLQKVSARIGPNGELGDPAMTRTATDFSKLVTTYLRLAGEPDRHEITGKEDAPPTMSWLDAVLAACDEEETQGDASGTSEGDGAEAEAPA